MKPWIVVSLLAVTGCAANPSGTDGTDNVAANERDLVCRYERSSGSHMRERICRTREQIEADREAAQSRRDLEDLETSGNDMSGGG